jgi:hypothetical protein
MKPRVLFVTQTLGEKAACGIGLMGNLVGQTLLGHPNYDFSILYSDDLNEIAVKINETQPAIVIYNYHPYSTPWLENPVLRQTFPNVFHIKLDHEVIQRTVDNFIPSTSDGWRYVVADAPDCVGTDNFFIVNRLLPATPTVKYTEPPKPIIGFQGFSAPYKGIARLAQQVNQEFDEAVIRLHMPYAYFIGRNGQDAEKRVAEVKSIITKPGIDIIYSHELLETQEIVDMMAQNTINCYFYDYLPESGIASSPDYALAARRPIAVTRSNMMRNFWDINPSVCIDTSSLKQIIANGTAPLEPLYAAYSVESVFADYKTMLDKLLRV